jgi:hypothetical protein
MNNASLFSFHIQFIRLIIQWESYNHKKINKITWKPGEIPCLAKKERERLEEEEEEDFNKHLKKFLFD